MMPKGNATAVAYRHFMNRASTRIRQERPSGTLALGRRAATGAEGRVASERKSLPGLWLCVAAGRCRAMTGCPNLLGWKSSNCATWADTTAQLLRSCAAGLCTRRAQVRIRVWRGGYGDPPRKGSNERPFLRFYLECVPKP
jgi:hypothetical protein